MGIPLPDELSIGARMRYAILSYFTMLQHYYFTLCDQIKKNVWLYAQKKNRQNCTVHLYVNKEY